MKAARAATHGVATLVLIFAAGVWSAAAIRKELSVRVRLAGARTRSIITTSSGNAEARTGNPLTAAGVNAHNERALASVVLRISPTRASIPMSSKVETVSSVILAAAACAMVAMFAVRWTSDAQSSGANTPRVTEVDGWNEATSLGRTLSGGSAPVTLLEIVDLECPACAGYSSTLDEVTKLHPDKVKLMYLAFPLPMHKHAMPAARAVECVREEPEARNIISVIYSNRDSLGLKSWSSLASAAGIKDTASFARCVDSDRHDRRIDAQVEMSKRLGAKGTPTIVLNGFRFSSPPSREELVRAIEAAAAGSDIADAIKAVPRKPAIDSFKVGSR